MNPMITLLYSLPDLGVAILFGLVTSAAFAVAPLLRARLFGRVSQAESEIARSTMATITSITGVVLAFSLVQAQGNLRAVQQTADQITRIDALARERVEQQQTLEANEAAYRLAEERYRAGLVTL